MARVVSVGNRSSSVDFTHTQGAIESVQMRGRSWSGFRLQNSSSDSPQKTAPDKLSHRRIIVSSSISEPLRRMNVESSKDLALEERAGSDTGKLSRWWDDLRRSVAPNHPKKSLQDSGYSGDMSSMGMKRSTSIWKRLLAKLRSLHAPKIRPARSERTTPQQQQQQQQQEEPKAYPLPKPNSPTTITLSAPNAIDDLNAISASFRSRMLRSRPYPMPAVPLWQRRNVRRPVPLNSHVIKMNRSRRR